MGIFLLKKSIHLIFTFWFLCSHAAKCHIVFAFLIFTIYFSSSADACGFINYPRSLYPKGRREMLTADHQCRCYGYKSAKTSEEIGVGYCGHFLQCLDENDEVHETLRPLDGTPCGIGRVCWETVCRSIKHGKPGKLSQQLEQSSSSHWKMQKRPLDLDI